MMPPTPSKMTKASAPAMPKTSAARDTMRAEANKKREATRAEQAKVSAAKRATRDAQRAETTKVGLARRAELTKSSVAKRAAQSSAPKPAPTSMMRTAPQTASGPNTRRGLKGPAAMKP